MPYMRGPFEELVERQRPATLYVSEGRRLVLVYDSVGKEVAVITPAEMRRAVKELDNVLPNE